MNAANGRATAADPTLRRAANSRTVPLGWCVPRVSAPPAMSCPDDCRPRGVPSILAQRARDPACVALPQRQRGAGHGVLAHHSAIPRATGRSGCTGAAAATIGRPTPVARCEAQSRSDLVDASRSSDRALTADRNRRVWASDHARRGLRGQAAGRGAGRDRARRVGAAHARGRPVGIGRDSLDTVKRRCDRSLMSRVTGVSWASVPLLRWRPYGVDAVTGRPGPTTLAIAPKISA
jgi:hypothetical protein